MQFPCPVVYQLSGEYQVKLGGGDGLRARVSAVSNSVVGGGEGEMEEEEGKREGDSGSDVPAVPCVPAGVGS